MKNLFFSCLGLLSAWLLVCCGERSPDSVKNAKDSNAARIDSQTATAHRDTLTHTKTIAVSKSDADFLVNASSGALQEVELGRLAATHAANRRVKSFGAMMVKDHGAGMEKLKHLASRKHVVLADSFTPDQQKEIDKLTKKRGADFDRAYIRMMVDDHQSDIKEFEKQASRGTDSMTRVFASSTLQMLRRHLDSANSLVAVLGLDRVQAAPMPPH